MNANLKIALRVLYRERQYALLNIVGLALAIACCLLLALYLREEFTYDRHNVLHKQIYRVESGMTVGEAETTFAATSQVLGPMLKERDGEIQAYTRFRPIDQDVMAIRYGDKSFYWSDVYFADPNVFSVFTHKILYGDPAHALDDPAAIAVSEKFARQYFGEGNPIGKTVTNETGIPLQVRLVFADLPGNSHLKYDVLVSFNSPILQIPDDQNLRSVLLWLPSVYTYLLLPKGYDVGQYRAISTTLYEQYMKPVGAGAKWRSWLQPLDDIHLYSDVGADRPRGNRYYLYAFAAVGLLIMVVACINYINLATARATKRARGVGLRKILGAPRVPLIVEFLTEAVLLALLATILGVVLLALALSLTPLPTLLGGSVRLDMLGEPSLAFLLVGFAVLLGLLAGIYPAMHLSSWTPLTALVSSGQARQRGTRFRKALVVVQMAISIGMLASALLMVGQMRFVSRMPLGFAKENRVMVTLRGAGVIEQLPTIINELAANARILGITTSETRIGERALFDRADLETDTGGQASSLMSNLAVGDNFLQVMGMRLEQGRGFDTQLKSDTGRAFVVNQSLVRAMGWREPLGKRVKLGVFGPEGRVVGVVNDFNFASLHTGIAPLLMYLSSGDLSNVAAENKPFLTKVLILNIAGAGIADTLRDIKATIAKRDAVHPFEFEFLDDSLNVLYTSDQRLMQLMSLFAGMCVLIGCLGLYGLTAYSAQQRTREIGTRKVLGATPSQIIWLLARMLIPLLTVGALAGSLLAYVVVQRWLDNFAYRAAINPLLFVAAATIAALITFGTVALQSSGVARRDPVDALRYE
jgi:putative ABC transport system permease protein